MTVADLLPSNATRLERDLSRTGDLLPHLGAGVERIRNAKRVDIPDSVVPWLIYEYGLGEITPYVPNLRQALAEGIQWQRLRGTRQAIEIGLGWIDFEGHIEESESGTRRWSDFQVALEEAPADLSDISNLVGITGLSAPIRSRLARVYGGYDERRFILDDHRLGEGLLCDHSGVYLRPDWPQLSFGRQLETLADFSAEGSFSLGIERISGIEWRYEDKFLLSHSLLDEWWHLSDVGSSQRGRLHFYSFGPLEIDCEIYPPRSFAWTGIYLSDDGWYLDDTHAAFSHRIEVESGSTNLVLSEGNLETGEGILSESVTRLELQELLKREDRVRGTELGYEQPPADLLQSRSTTRAAEVVYEDRFLLSAGILDEQWHLLDVRARTATHTRLWQYGDPSLQEWSAEFSWGQAGTWQGLRIGSSRTDERAGIFLSEDYLLGDTNTRFHVELWDEIGLGIFELSEAEPGDLITGPDWEGLAELGFISESGDGPFVLSDSELSEHVADAQVAPAEFAINGLHRLSEHLVRRVPVGAVEVFDRIWQRVVTDDQLGTITSARSGRHTTASIYEDRFLTSAALLDEQWHLVDLLSRDVQHTRTHAYDGESVLEVSNTRANTIAALGQGDTEVTEASRTAERESVFAYPGELAATSRTAEREVLHSYDGETIAEVSRTGGNTIEAAGQGDTIVREASRTSNRESTLLVEVELFSSKTAEHGFDVIYYGDQVSDWSANATWNEAGGWVLKGTALTRDHSDLVLITVALEDSNLREHTTSALGWLLFATWEHHADWDDIYWNPSVSLIESNHESSA